jgi:membrane associated rhomboid family serine protease
MTDDSKTILRVIDDERLAHEWELVLLAQGLSPTVHRTQSGIVLAVPRDEVDGALAGLAAYEKENPAKTPPRDIPTESANMLAGTLAGLFILGFFAVTASWNPAASWLQRGSANAGRMLDGELWRSVTALTLHGDAGHALSNAFAIAVFFGAVSGRLGVGVAGLVVLLAGALGNLANALLQGSPHNSVGASTAIFGAVGILGSLALIRRHRARGTERRAWIAVAAALALLGLLGAGGGRVDIMAHFLGFIIGGFLGIPVAFVYLRPAGFAIQWTCAAATLAVIFYCWLIAVL